MNVEDLGNNKYKVGDIVVLKKKAVWSGSDEITGKITGIDYDDDFGWFYYTDIKRNGKPIEILEKSIVKKINQKKNMEKTLQIKGKTYKQLYVSENIPDMLRLFGIFMDWKEKPYLDADMRVRRADGKDVGVIVMRYRGKWRMLQEMFYKTKNSNKKQTDMNRKRNTAKAHGSATTMRDASRILKAQKDDYKKIFRSEVKKSKDPKAGAKKAGKIYRDRYGATATARWKKALKRAK